MALTLLTDAYDTLANVTAYHVARGNDNWTGIDTATGEEHIRNATDWIDRNYDFKGKRKTLSQRLSFPRTGLYIDGFLFGDTDSPLVIKEATAIVAELYRVGALDLDGIIKAKGAIKRERVEGAVEIEYENSGVPRAGVTLTHVSKLLKDVIVGNGRLYRA